jgi:hypothetical protein
MCMYCCLSKEGHTLQSTTMTLRNHLRLSPLVWILWCPAESLAQAVTASLESRGVSVRIDEGKRTIADLVSLP